VPGEGQWGKKMKREELTPSTGEGAMGGSTTSVGKKKGEHKRASTFSTFRGVWEKKCRGKALEYSAQGGITGLHSKQGLLPVLSKEIQTL